MLLKSFLAGTCLAVSAFALPQQAQSPSATNTSADAPAASSSSGKDAIVVKALSDITSSLKGISDKLAVWKGDATEASTVVSDAQKLLTTITVASKDVSGVSELPIADAVNVLQPANALIKEEKAVIEALVKAKPELEKSQLTSTVKEILSKFKSEASVLLGAVKKILPSNVKTVADSIGKQINLALDKGIAAYA